MASITAYPIPRGGLSSYHVWCRSKNKLVYILMPKIRESKNCSSIGISENFKTFGLACQALPYRTTPPIECIPRRKHSHERSMTS